jgi:hypothetical protein
MFGAGMLARVGERFILKNLLEDRCALTKQRLVCRRPRKSGENGEEGVGGVAELLPWS